MANQVDTDTTQEDKKRLKQEKKQLKEEQKEQRKEAKQRAKEISKQEDELDDDQNGFLTFFATILIIVVWLAVICVIIKLDVGGFGTNVMTPILKNVPVVNRILPKPVTEVTEEDGQAYGSYTNLKDAVEQIRTLEMEIEKLQNEVNVKKDDIDNLRAEVSRLQEFERKQDAFERIQKEFAEEVVYAEKGPGADAFRKYYEALDPATAEYMYKQVVYQDKIDKEIQEYVTAYSKDNMKPKQAAAIFETMTDNLSLVARILEGMTPDDRGAILGVMDSEVAGRLTKIMDPDS